MRGSSILKVIQDFSKRSPFIGFLVIVIFLYGILFVGMGRKGGLISIPPLLKYFSDDNQERL